MMGLNAFNALPESTARSELMRCCGARKWVEQMLQRRPFADTNVLFHAAEDLWLALDRQSWLEAFQHHPRIGELSDLKKKFAATASLSADEQKGVASAQESILLDLQRLNRQYEEKFGHVFLIFATGKSAADMLTALRSRLQNSAETELKNAVQEHSKITRLRLEKMLNAAS